jgi:MFS family permease
MSVVVTGLCLVAVVGAGLLAFRLRDTRRPSPLVKDAAPGAGDRLAGLVGRAAGMVAGALVAGVLVLGFGGRLMMRALAVSSSGDVQGRFTDQDAVVGEVTLGGTFFLVLFVGGFGGMFALLIYAVVRRWLPDRSALAGLVGLALGAGLLAQPSGLLDPDNPDFGLLAPLWLAVLLCVGLLVLFGVVFGVLVDTWAASWPRPGRSLRGGAALLPFAPLLLAPLALGLVAAGGLLATYLGSWYRGLRQVATIDAVGRAAVFLLASAGGAWTLVAAVEILTL